MSSAGRGTQPAAVSIEEAARIVAGGGLVCLPTESTYGLAADIRVPAALARLAQLKGARPRTSPFALIAATASQARDLCRVWPDAAEELALRHWPGPLTLVLPARLDLPPELVGPEGGVGVRLSSHPVAALVAAATGGPITATSANRSGEPPAQSLDQARAALGDAVDAYVDGGTCAGVASTVVALAADGRATVIRRGAVSF